MGVVTRHTIRDLLQTTIKDLPLWITSEVNFKVLFEIWGHPIITLIKLGQSIPVGLRIYYNIPAAWVLEWRRKWA